MIDAHHHIWRQTDLPWLNGPEQPRIFGLYKAIMRDYPIEEFREDLAGTGIKKSVYVQANWAPDRAENEAAWVQSEADRNGWPHAIVGYCDFTADDVSAQLRRLKRYPLMRGVRQQLHWHHNPLYRFAPHAGLPADPKVRRNIALLADFGWSFDLQVFQQQMVDAAGLAASCPDVTFVLQHAGMLSDDTPEERRSWETGLRRLADEPNIACKLSAFGTFIHRNDAAFIADMVAKAVEIFGADRCLFGSNFPIEKLWTSYADLWAAFQTATDQLSQSDRQKIFNDTAARVYRL
ncbi:MAG: amidohydrolase family protein [Rhizobiaceae bacterium]